jgi:hypothetical protein
LIKDWRQVSTWIVGLLVFLTLLWLYLYAKLIDLAVFGAMLAALIALITLITTQLSSHTQTQVLNRQRDTLEDIKHTLQAKPILQVTFSTGESEIELAADWSEPVKINSLFKATLLPFGDSEPLPPGNAPLRFSVTNVGDIAAEEPSIYIDLPQQCKVIESSGVHLLVTKDAPWHSFADTRKNQIRITGDSLSPGLSHHTPYIWVVFPEAPKAYELAYSAYANNISTPDCGKLVVHIADKNTPPNKDFPGDEEEF